MNDDKLWERAFLRIVKCFGGFSYSKVNKVGSSYQGTRTSLQLAIDLGYGNGKKVIVNRDYYVLLQPWSHWIIYSEMQKGV